VPHARRYFRAFDIFALSSDHEPFGMVLLEAMAANVPLVSTNCGGAREIVEGLGQLFALGNAEQLAEALTATANTGPNQAARCQRTLANAIQRPGGSKLFLAAPCCCPTAKSGASRLSKSPGIQAIIHVEHTPAVRHD
jgi:glycosyltransferase involved in cell wall biosynthesis